jgi:hypothetical protein
VIPPNATLKFEVELLDAHWFLVVVSAAFLADFLILPDIYQITA